MKNLRRGGVGREEIRNVDLVVRSDDQSAAVFERVEEEIEQRQPHFGLQLAKQIAADDQIEVRIRRVFENVMRRKDYALTHVSVDAELTPLADKEAVDARLFDRCNDFVRIQTHSRPLQRIVRNIAGE